MSSKLGDKPEISMKPLLDYLLSLNYRGEVRRSDHLFLHGAYIGTTSETNQPNDELNYILIT